MKKIKIANQLSAATLALGIIFLAGASLNIAQAQNMENAVLSAQNSFSGIELASFHLRPKKKPEIALECREIGGFPNDNNCVRKHNYRISQGVLDKLVALVRLMRRRGQDYMKLSDGGGFFSEPLTHQLDFVPSGGKYCPERSGLQPYCSEYRQFMGHRPSITEDSLIMVKWLGVYGYGSPQTVVIELRDGYILDVDNKGNILRSKYSKEWVGDFVEKEISFWSKQF